MSSFITCDCDADGCASVGGVVVVVVNIILTMHLIFIPI